MADIIYLASGSQSRRTLLKFANLPFQVIQQDFDESSIARNHDLEATVTKIAQSKMEHAIVPNGKQEGQISYVLTADTMGLSANGEICGKPRDKEDAIRMLKLHRQGIVTGTAFCLDQKIWTNEQWQLKQRVQRYVTATYVFDIPDQMLELYFKHAVACYGISYLDISGAVGIEEYGLQFVTNFHGSVTAVMGLPLYELRQALIAMNFQFE